ncbi:MAG TPA: M1 family aminopeptidase, partial [Candidatus Cloacimonadota bacterium]|nr:M1 family aminopeptidase [Candidatus Cloacimonadota bacterium]
MIPVTILFGGFIVWREKDYKTQEIYFSLPVTDTQRCIAKISAIAGIQITYLSLSILIGIIFQALAYRYFDFETGLYFKRFYLMEMLNYLQLTIIVVLIQITVRNKVLGFLINSVLFIANIILMDFIRLDMPLINWGHFPNFTYSNLNGFQPYSKLLVMYWIYLALFTGIIFMLTVFIWKSSENDSIKQRFRYSLSKISKGQKRVFFSLLILFLLQGSFIAWNRYKINSYYSVTQGEKGLVAYEKQCQPYINYPQLNVTAVSFNVDLFPSEQSAQIMGSYILKNKTDKQIDTVFISLWNQKRAALKKMELNRQYSVVKPMKDYSLGIYKLVKALQPGDSLILNFEVDYQTHGFTDNNTECSIVKNGTMMNLGGSENQNFIPQIGINKSIFISKEELRKKYNLPKYKELQTLEKADRKTPFANFDVIRYNCQVSTEKGQIALTNGELLKQWDEGNRSYFIYKPLIPVSNELVITSGIYQVKKEQYHGINLEVFYYEKHHRNLDRIIRGFKKSIDLNHVFSNYPHKTLRIIETPAYMNYAAARAYPAMYVWNENSGFTYQVDEKAGSDQVFAISAHEMAHHWWGYELLPAETEGLYFLIESMAEFMCTLATEKEYGKDKALQYVKDSRIRYLRSRGRAKEEEVPLSRVHHNQSYLAYQKGMIQLYTLKEYIGEKALIRGLKDFYDQYSLAGKDRFSQKDNLYPISTDMIQALAKVCPDSLRY